jgi:hypothetical protein
MVLRNSNIQTGLGHSTLQDTCYCDHSNKLGLEKPLIRQHETQVVLVLCESNLSVFYIYTSYQGCNLL